MLTFVISRETPPGRPLSASVPPAERPETAERRPTAAERVFDYRRTLVGGVSAAPAGFSTVAAVASHMSDSDDGFDEEAVREELREKYEDERGDREATARM